MPNRRRDLSNPAERQTDLEERLREKGLDPEGRPLREKQKPAPMNPPSPD